MYTREDETKYCLCPVCGKDHHIEEARFCTICGTKLEEASAKDSL